MQRDDQIDHLRRLYAGLTDKELSEIAARLDQYLALAQRIYERIEKDPEAAARFRQLLEDRRKEEEKPEA